MNRFLGPFVIKVNKIIKVFNYGQIIILLEMESQNGTVVVKIYHFQKLFIIT